jgi:hypothetical protein
MSIPTNEPTGAASRPARAKAISDSAVKSSVYGIAGFTLLSLAGFAPWALGGRWFYKRIGEAGLYLVCAGVFLLLSGPLLHRLIAGPGSLRRLYKVFTPAFGAYAVLWIGGWMAFHGHTGSIVGLLAGTAGMGIVLARFFRVGSKTWQIIAVLFVLNAAGYFLGGVVEGQVMGLPRVALFGTALSKPAKAILAKLLWGVFYGIGFGAGLGLAFYLCQRRFRTPAPAAATRARES